MDSGRRAEYRVELSANTDLTVSLPAADGSRIEGRLNDVSGSGAGVCFDSADAPVLAVGQHVDLIFDSGSFAGPLTVASQVQHRTEADANQAGRRRYGFRFLEPQQLDAHLPAEARRYFNRRQAVRVSPGTFEPVDVSLQAGEEGDPIDVRLHNISVTGVGVSLEPALEMSFADRTQVNLCIQLPGSRRPIGIVGNIRYRRLVGERIHYGIAFDTELTEKFTRKRRALARYVIRRQNHYLRASA